MPASTAEVTLLNVVTSTNSRYYVNCEAKKVRRMPGDTADGLKNDNKWQDYDRLDNPVVGRPFSIFIIDSETDLSFQHESTNVTYWTKFWSDGDMTTSEDGDNAKEKAHGSEGTAALFDHVRGR